MQVCESLVLYISETYLTLSRERRVKCDETKPACIRYISAPSA